MWWSSFLAVLDDLRCFVFGIAQRSDSSVKLDARQTRHKNPEDQVATVDTKITLEPNVRYTKEHSVTQAIRTKIKQATAIQPATRDLTQLEWLAYLFNNPGRPLPWTVLTIVPIGKWNLTLKELSDITISTAPKTQAMIEWHDSENHGHIGVVVRVTPDDTITVHELGGLASGTISETTWSLAVWRPLNPVFISIL